MQKNSEIKNMKFMLFGKRIFCTYTHYIMRLELHNFQSSGDGYVLKPETITRENIANLDFRGGYALSHLQHYIYEQKSVAEGFCFTDDQNEYIGYLFILKKGADEIAFKVRNANAFLSCVCVREDVRGKHYANAMISFVKDYLAKNNINVDIILQSVGREGTKDISFTVSQEDLKPALAILEEYQEPMTIREIKWEDTVAKISIVGAGMMSNPGVAAKLFESLYNNGININMISTSEIRITVLIDEKEIDKSMQAVHDGLGLGDV